MSPDFRLRRRWKDNYAAALSVPGIDISQTIADRSIFGFGLNAEQEISKNIGMFSRIGWNDGHNEAWMFSDVNHSGSLGVDIKDERWHCSSDTLGVGDVVSGISHSNQLYLQAGRFGILDGDGNLNYRPEFALESFYDHAFRSMSTQPWITSSLPIQPSTARVAPFRFSEQEFIGSS